MAALQQEYPGVLLGILEELANMRQWLTFQDLCRMVSTRFDLDNLLELRSLLFAAASRDPCFPATLFRDRVSARGQGLSPIGVAADIVTIFNLIQMTGGVSESSHPVRAQTVLPVDQSPGPSLPGIHPFTTSGRDRARAHSEPDGRSIDQHLLLPKSNYSGRKRASLPPDPISLVSSPPIRTRAVSFDLPHTTYSYSSSSNLDDVVKSIYLPLETDSDSSGDSATMEVFEAEHGSSVDQRRNIFRKDFHNQPPLIPQVTVSSESPSPIAGHMGFDNHSFEMIPNPYPSPTVVHLSPELRASTKHGSLEDNQASTYFGPGSDPSPRQLQPPRTKKSVWTSKSHSLEDRIGKGNIDIGTGFKTGQLPRRSTPAISRSSGGESADGRLPHEDDRVKAQSTQTETPDPRRLRSLVHADRLSFMTSLDDPEFGEDDISAIFRFLDDISMCGSTGFLNSSDGTANQDTPEGRRGRLGQLQRLFHSLESSDDGLKASVCKLLLRMSQIERQLESLNDVKSEISQVLSALQRLDEKIQQPVVGGEESTGRRWLEPLSGVSSFMSHPMTPSESSEPQPLSATGHFFQGISTTSLDWNRWNNTGDQAESGIGQVDSKGAKEGKKDASSRRASRTQLDEKSLSDSKQLNVSSSARDWLVSFSKSKDGKSSQRKIGQADQSDSTTNLLSQKPSMVEQVLSSPLFHQKESSLRRGLGSLKVSDHRLAEGGGRPVWTINDREARVSPLNLQGQESLNPNNMEFWMDEIYTPGYNGLIRPKAANLRRLKICKLVALIAVVVTIILIIVIPLCIVGS